MYVVCSLMCIVLFFDLWSPDLWSPDLWSTDLWSPDLWSTDLWLPDLWSTDLWLPDLWSLIAWSLINWSLITWSLITWSLINWSLINWSFAWSLINLSLIAWSLINWSLIAWSLFFDCLIFDQLILDDHWLFNNFSRSEAISPEIWLLTNFHIVSEDPTKPENCQKMGDGHLLRTTWINWSLMITDCSTILLGVRRYHLKYDCSRIFT